MHIAFAVPSRDSRDGRGTDAGPTRDRRGILRGWSRDLAGLVAGSRGTGTLRASSASSIAGMVTGSVAGLAFLTGSGRFAGPFRGIRRGIGRGTRVIRGTSAGLIAGLSRDWRGTGAGLARDWRGIGRGIRSPGAVRRDAEFYMACAPCTVALAFWITRSFHFGGVLLLEGSVLL